MDHRKKIGLAAAAVAASGALAFGIFGTTTAFADPSTSPTPGTTSSAGTTARPERPAMGTEVTGDELAKVTDAVKAKDSAITVEKVMKKADGSYAVMGTKDGSRVRVDVSADLATVSDAQTGGKGGPGGRGGDKGGPMNMADNHTAVTGDELAKVTDAVKAKDSAITVTEVWKDADGSYDVIGTKDSAPVRVEVSADLATVSDIQTGGKGGPGKGGPKDMAANHTAVAGDELAKVTDAVKAKDSAVTVTEVWKDADGSYDVIGTKDSARVHVEVSSDLQTVEVKAGRR